MPANKQLWPGDTVYLEDITDPMRRYPVNYRGPVHTDNGEMAVVVWAGSQMTVPVERIYRKDVTKN